MSISDPISDFLTRIRNAQQREKSKVQAPASKMLIAIAEILKQEGFLSSVEVLDTKPQKTLEVEIKYVNGEPAIRDLKRISKPGIRKYVGYKDIPRVKRGLGVAILSTPKGIMTGKQAKAEKVGGEYLCDIY